MESIRVRKLFFLKRNHFFRFKTFDFRDENLNGPNPAFFVYFRSFHKAKTNLTLIYKSIDGVFGTQTQGGRMEGADQSTELWWQPKRQNLYLNFATNVYWTHKILIEAFGLIGFICTITTTLKLTPVACVI